MSKQTDQMTVLDPCGFPMVWVEAVQRFVHWLPITKIQLEHFLCRAPRRRFDARWYEEVLALNPRISPREVTSRNYWRAFATGLQPAECTAFQRFLGDGYEVPTADQWKHIYAAELDAPPLSPEHFPRAEMTPRVVTLLDKLDAVAADKNIKGKGRAKQRFLDQGVVEWVTTDASLARWVGMGNPHKNFHSRTHNLGDGPSVEPRRPDESRIEDMGLRLLRATL